MDTLSGDATSCGCSLRIGSEDEHPASADVAAFVGQANLWPATVAGPETVDTLLGRISTDPHTYAAGARVTVMVRPEKVRLGVAPDHLNTFKGEVRLDRFLGSVLRAVHESATGDG